MKFLLIGQGVRLDGVDALCVGDLQRVRSHQQVHPRGRRALRDAHRCPLSSASHQGKSSLALKLKPIIIYT